MIATRVINSPDFVAEVSGVDLASLDDEAFSEIDAAFNKYAVLVFRDQKLTEEQQLAFATRFGPLEISVQPFVSIPDERRRIRTGFSDISNLDEKGNLLGENDNRRLINLANQLWHTDSSFKRTPGLMSMLHAQEVVSTGGETEFADMRAAWDVLPDNRKRQLQDLIAEHDYFHSRKRVGLRPESITPDRRALRPPVPQVLVRTHPSSGRRSLYLASHICGIYGMDSTQSKALIDELMAHATRAQFLYLHRWSVNDVVMWDNRCTMHRGRPFDETQRRAMRRATVSDVGPTVHEAWQPPALALSS